MLALSGASRRHTRMPLVEVHMRILILRAQLKTCVGYRIYAFTFALMLAIPATRVALTVAHNDTLRNPGPAHHHHVSYGQHVTISGIAAPAQPARN